MKGIWQSKDITFVGRIFLNFKNSSQVEITYCKEPDKLITDKYELHHSDNKNILVIKDYDQLYYPQKTQPNELWFRISEEDSGRVYGTPIGGTTFQKANKIFCEE